MKKIFCIIYVVTYFIPVGAQNDTINADGLFLKYQGPSYLIKTNGVPSITIEQIRNKDFPVYIPDDSDMIRGELDRITDQIGLTYKTLPQYVISESFSLSAAPINPVELHRTAGYGILSQWIHGDGECILFIKCPRVNTKIDKSLSKFPEDNFYVLKQNLKMGSIDTPLTEKEIKKIKKKTKFWTSEKSKEIFNAQYVITYPIKDKKAVFMDKYSHRMDLIMVKWGQDFRVSFLLTKKGYKDRKKYIQDVQEAFWFED